MDIQVVVLFILIVQPWFVWHRPGPSFIGLDVVECYHNYEEVLFTLAIASLWIVAGYRFHLWALNILFSLLAILFKFGTETASSRLWTIPV